MADRPRLDRLGRGVDVGTRSFPRPRHDFRLAEHGAKLVDDRGLDLALASIALPAEILANLFVRGHDQHGRW
jgi:predicted ArsR family transcriptional regulator